MRQAPAMNLRDVLVLKLPYNPEKVVLWQLHGDPDDAKSSLQML